MENNRMEGIPMLDTKTRKQEILDAFHFRHATKRFNDEKKLKTRIFTSFWKQADCLRVQSDLNLGNF